MPRKKWPPPSKAKLVRFNDIYAGPWENELFAVRHYRAGWLRDISPAHFNFDKNEGNAPKVYTISADAETDVLVLAARMEEPVEHFKIVPLLIMDEETWDSSIDGG